MTASRTAVALVALACLALAVPDLVRAQGADARPEADGWRILFNGKDLTGWKQLNGAHVYGVEDGVIVGTTVPGEPNGFLVTEEDFGDFVLEFEVLADVLMNNSGVQFRSLSHAGYRDGRVHGYQAEIDTKPQRWSGSIYDEARRGWMYTMEINPAAQGAFVNNAWNHYRIEAIGHTSRIWVNGVPTAHFVDAETARGFIGLQLHANNPNDPPGAHQIRFRNLRIKTEDLQPAPFDDVFVVNTIPNDVSSQEEAQGFSLLWDGRTTGGWRGADGGDVPARGWEIRGGELAVLPAGGQGGLLTEAQYGAFEMKFEFKLHEEGGICGVAHHVAASDAKDVPSTYCRMASQKTRDAGAWNQGVIRAHPNGMVEYWLNGFQILEYRRSPDAPARGHILLQDHGDAVSYRSVKIKEIR